MPARSISTKALRAECTLIERAVRTGGASAETLAPYRPGGPQNAATDATGWLAYYRHLHRLHARQTAGASATPSATARLADADIVDALRSLPVPVRRVGSAVEDAPLYVYAKSFDALVQVHALDRQLAWMTDQHRRLLTLGTPEAMDRLPQALDAIAYTYHLLAWIVTTPGPDMPYAYDDDRPVPPPAIRALEAWDITRVIEAHHTHLRRLHAITALLDPRPVTPEGQGTRPSWSAFWGTMELETGTSAETLMKHRALASVLASTRMGTGARADAYEAAKAAPPERP